MTKATAGRIALFSLALLALPLAATARPVANPAGLTFKAGTYRCELNRSVQVTQVAPDLQTAVIHWNKKDYTLKAVSTKSGALRYEDASSGLVWLVIVDKSMLLDSRAGRQLANECRN
ncbi:MAG TPA: MliC family protein [Burkholderiaceae bacterium]|nr:MliC family protein [Burkholderiaceae bacterium]